ncbi:MAG: TIM barrel protein [Patescibacteria group bacterium]
MQNILCFGTGGVPLSAAPRDTIAGLERLSELGLNHMEVEWVHGVRLSEEKAREIGSKAQELNISLTAHGPYYINLNAIEPDKRKASRQRIIDSCRLGQMAGVRSVCFHAAFYLGQEPTQVFDRVLTEMLQIEDELAKEGIDKIWLAPELTGKPTQFGDLEELIMLAKTLNRTRLCIDFAHYFARYAGKRNSKDEFRRVVDRVRKELGIEVVNNMHIHYSGIEYSAKGERHHLDLDESHFNWKGLLEVLAEEKVGGYMVCEGPHLEYDALKAKQYYDNYK